MTDREALEQRYKDHFLNPDALSSHSQFRAELTGRLYHDFLDFLISETDKAYAKGAHQFLESQYGKRCPDYDENCFICQHWDAYDDWVKEKPPSMRG